LNCAWCRSPGQRRPAQGLVGVCCEGVRFRASCTRLRLEQQIQERLTDDIATAFEVGLAPRGVLVVVESSHQCVTARGANERGAVTVTVASRGLLTDPAARAEIMSVFGVGSRE